MSGETPNGGGQSPANVEVAYATADVYRTTDALLDHFEAKDVSVGLGVFALVVALGRVLGPEEGLEGEKEQEFVRGVLDYITAYFASGPVN